MTRFVGIVGSGMIGRDPFDPKCWSCSSRNLFLALLNNNSLSRAFGVEVSAVKRYLLILKNFKFDKNAWRSCFNLDPHYYNLLTKEIEKKLLPNDYSNIILQIGGHYSSFEACKGRIPCYSYHDGNVSGLMKSPYFDKTLMCYAKKAFDYEKKVYEKLDKIFVMSGYWRQSFVNDFKIEPNKVVDIGMGVNINIPDIHEKDYSRKEIIFIGIDFVRKGGYILLEAFSKVRTKHKDAILHIVGPLSLPSNLKNYNRRGGIIYHGYLSREKNLERDKLRELLKQSTIAVLPSLFEPFGNSILESMAYQIPGIASNAWSFPDFVLPGKTGQLTTVGSVDSLSDALDFYLSDENARAIHGKNARRMVLKKYTWEIVGDRLKEYL